jgi:hypothetical protein
VTINPTSLLTALAFTALQGATLLAVAGAAQAATPDVVARAQESWRASITQTPVPKEGCFRASFPDQTWHEVACSAAPNRPFLPRSAGRVSSRVTGNGNDYSANTKTLTSSAVGSFPVVTGVTSEKGYGNAPNYYSLQLNSGFMNTAVCNTSTTGQCQSWEQFVYSSSETSAFMQYWLINYGSKCPAGQGWMAYQGSCYKNSAAVSVPQLAISNLGTMKVSASAVSGGIDTLVFTAAGDAYSTTGKDSVVDLATAWVASEFNIVGDGGGSEARFNKGSSVTVNIALTDGSTAAPTCAARDGTTGETNNLTLHACKATSGSTPSVSFTETH